MTPQPQEWDHREDGRLAFRDARRELDWSANHYRQARHAITAGNGSPRELSRTQQAWSWALAEWVRALTYREEAMDGVGVVLDAGLGEDRAQGGEPSPTWIEFQEGGQKAEANYSELSADSPQRDSRQVHGMLVDN